MISYILVFIQFFVSFLMFVNVLLHFHFSFTGAAVFLAGFCIGIAALYYNPPSNINIRPDIKENSVLIMHGIYKYIRHPMYLSVILMTFGLFLFDISWTQFILWMIVFSDMIFKMNYEENLWIKDKGYKEYMSKTYKLIPFIY
ncbi:hypothetical protein C3L23_07600 [Nautilia sp. PV-1]|uniref:methyltransferase family protein n=1 Tax=Nautilia sp. PV-1 TaxID=2579250 RepID=UPI000FD79079|nr:methyltransferase [Nautilia sp. PV-1]AZV47142.1 hypothetical protein C3L23_07600 [Nautilia sp. PV-1]